MINSLPSFEALKNTWSGRDRFQLSSPDSELQKAVDEKNKRDLIRKTKDLKKKNTLLNCSIIFSCLIALSAWPLHSLYGGVLSLFLLMLGSSLAIFLVSTMGEKFHEEKIKLNRLELNKIQPTPVTLSILKKNILEAISLSRDPEEKKILKEMKNLENYTEEFCEKLKKDVQLFCAQKKEFLLTEYAKSNADFIESGDDDDRVLIIAPPKKDTVKTTQMALDRNGIKIAEKNDFVNNKRDGYP